MISIIVPFMIPSLSFFYHDVRTRLHMGNTIHENKNKNNYEYAGCPLSNLFMVFVRLGVSANKARMSLTNSSIGKSTSAPCSNKYVISASDASMSSERYENFSQCGT